MKRITIKFLNHHNACDEAKEWFNSLKQDSYSVSYIIKLLLKDGRRLDWINWGIVRLMNKKQQVAYAIFAAEQVIKIFTDKYPNDNRPQEAINAAKKYLSNPCKATKKAASIAADAAADAAYYYVAASAAAAAYCSACAARSAARAIDAGTQTTDCAVYAADCAMYTCIGSVKIKRTLQRKIINYGLKLIT